MGYIKAKLFYFFVSHVFIWARFVCCFPVSFSLWVLAVADCFFFFHLLFLHLLCSHSASASSSASHTLVAVAVFFFYCCCALLIMKACCAQKLSNRWPANTAAQRESYSKNYSHTLTGTRSLIRTRKLLEKSDNRKWKIVEKLVTNLLIIFVFFFECFEEFET